MPAPTRLTAAATCSDPSDLGREDLARVDVRQRVVSGVEEREDQEQDEYDGRRRAGPQADGREDDGAQPLRRDGQQAAAGLVDQQERDDDPGQGDGGEPDSAGESAGEAVLFQHTVGEGGDREVRCHGAEPEHRDEQCGAPVLLGEQHPEAALADVLVLDVVKRVVGHVLCGEGAGLVLAAHAPQPAR